MRCAVRTLGVVLFLLALASPAFAYDEVFSQRYPLSGGGTFTLWNVNGSVEITGWERDQVDVRAVLSAPWSEDDLAQVKVDVQADPRHIAVATRYPRGASGVEVSVDYQIHVPYRVLLGRVETVNGSVRVAGVEGSGDLHSVNGNVEVSDSAGRFSAHTTNGNVRLELRRLSPGAPMTVETVNGSAVLALPPEADAELEVRSFNGDFRSEIPATVRGAATAQRFRARLGRGGSNLMIQTVNGGIRILAVRPAV